MFGIYFGGRFLAARSGWGPCFTSFVDDAKKFKSERAALSYISANLPDFGASVCHLPTA